MRFNLLAVAALAAAASAVAARKGQRTFGKADVHSSVHPLSTFSALTPAQTLTVEHIGGNAIAEGVRLMSRGHPSTLEGPAAIKRLAAFATSYALGADTPHEFVTDALSYAAEGLELAKQLQKGTAAVDAVLAQRLGFHLVQTSENGAHAAWMTEAEKLQLRQLGVKFIDMTSDAVSAAKGEVNLAAVPAPKAAPLPAAPAQNEKVEAVISTLNTDLMKSTLKALTGFHTRYYNSDNGRQSSAWVHEQVLNIIKSTGRSDVTAHTFKHSFPQTSSIAVIPGSSKPDEIVIVSAHQDSTHLWLPWFAAAPGADDDGSGTVTILEAFRGLLAGGFKPERTVEFHWYAGEEAGLLGSKDIANAYKKSGRAVHAQAQFDMTGYPQYKDKVGIINDHTHPELTELLRKLFKTYTDVQPVDFKCGYGCSDHASWAANGYRSSAPFESASLDNNGNIHSERDTYETIDFDHALHFSKVAAAFAIELAA